MEGLQNGVRVVRLFYVAVAIAAFVLAAGAVAPLFTGGGTGGCQVVLSIGAPASLGPAGPSPAPQPSPGPSVSGALPVCAQYIDVAPAILAGVLGAILLLTVMRLGQDPATWRLVIALGAIAGILASFAAAYAVLGIARSDQPQATPGLASIVIAALPVFAAIGSALALWRAHARATPD
jgi:hypothetical protein